MQLGVDYFSIRSGRIVYEQNRQLDSVMATFHRPHRIHVRFPDWRKYTTRRVLIVASIAVLCYGIDYLFHMHSAGKCGELGIGAVLGHCLLEVEA